jgi:natural product biosynthesis luciferase-like monooxygenase protein
MSQRRISLRPLGRPRRATFIGDRALVLACADLARQHGLDVVGLVSAHPGAPEWAAERGIALRTPVDGLDAATNGLDADVLFSVGNLRIVPAAVLARHELAVNFHDGPLPDLAGLHATSWAIAEGRIEHEITWHEMTEGVDTGEVIATAAVRIGPDDTAYDLNTACFDAALASVGDVFDQIASGTVTLRAQPARPGTYRGRFDRPGGATLVDPARPAADTARLVRALDLGGRIENPLGSARLVVGDDVLLVAAARAVATTTGAPPGTVSPRGDGLHVTTVDGELVVDTFTDADGVAVPTAVVAGLFRHRPGGMLESPAALATVVDADDPSWARAEGRTRSRLMVAASVEGRPAPLAPAAEGHGVNYRRAIVHPTRVSLPVALAAIGAWAVRTTDVSEVVVAVGAGDVLAIHDRAWPLLRRPLAVVSPSSDEQATVAELVQAAADEADAALGAGAWLADLVARDPDHRGAVVGAAVALDMVEGAVGDAVWHPDRHASIHVRVGDDGVEVHLDGRVHDDDAAAALASQLEAVLATVASDPEASLWRFPLLRDADAALLGRLNATARPLAPESVVDAFERAVAAWPDAPAVSAGTVTLTYAQLDAASAAVAGNLAACGVRRGDRVGIALHRDDTLVPVLWGVLRAGAAYVPLDPTYPDARLADMAADAGLAAVVAHEASAPWHPAGVPVLAPEVLLDRRGLDDIATRDALRINRPWAADLAYVIYTSGSTGRPKGVMVEHRNVVNFLLAMDEVIDHDAPGVWLAVTSLSFDISVLELLWTLSRGFHVVVRPDPSRKVVPATRSVAVTRPTFSLFYFASAEADGEAGYRLLLEGARFADAHGLEAIWTPERHFHAFGGIYPNPAVAGAAIAAVTERVAVRAGSVVLPLHSPITVAEDWSVVDNLSRGRVGVAMAAGWQPNDFVLAPDAYADSKGRMVAHIETLRRLWRGETLTFPGPKGDVEVHTLPRPVQRELPIWITTAGSAETFSLAGRLGCNLLTHLLGQSADQLADKIASYRRAWRDAGHRGEGRVTLMLHTYLDDDHEASRRVAAGPLAAYLGSAASLLKDAASTFPTLRNAGSDADEIFASLSPEEVQQLLAAATDRYLETSGLFGSPTEAMAMVRKVVALGVDEIACLVDFGVDHDHAVAGFDRIAELMEMAALELGGITDTDEDTSVAALVGRHGVTHLQGTPSLAAMLLADPDDRRALHRLRHVLVGGEALPEALAAELLEVCSGRITNMYGPTETTVWSLVHELEPGASGAVPIGRPIANTTLAVLDTRGEPCAIGALGELHIGGAGVTRGYHAREELTAARFVERGALGRVYGTGDLVSIDRDGVVHYAGRIDHQVKISGHRIELGEIEAVLERDPGVARAVVRPWGSGADAILVGYVVARSGAALDENDLRRRLGESLPDFMAPSRVITLAELPLTPNGKIDRKALPDPRDVAAALTPLATPAGSVERGTGDHSSTTGPGADDAGPGTLSSGVAVGDERRLEALVASTWASALGKPVGRDDNFFEVGGHSLVAVKVFRQLGSTTGLPLALTDVFRHPTARALGAHLAVLERRQVNGGPARDHAPAGADPSAPAPAPVVARDAERPDAADRGARRRAMLARRRDGEH